MDAAEVADTITETGEERHHAHAEGFRSRAAIVIAILAAILAVCDLGGDNSKDAMIYNNIKASDTWAFYQAKNVRQTEYKLAADELKRRLGDPTVAEASKASLKADLDKYEKTVARYEDEPDPKAPGDAAKGEGKKQLSAQAKGFEQARERASEKNDSFDYAQMLLQLAIVLGSVSILAISRPLLIAAGVLGAAGAALLLNGFILFIHLPG